MSFLNNLFVLVIIVVPLSIVFRFKNFDISLVELPHFSAFSSIAATSLGPNAGLNPDLLLPIERFKSNSSSSERPFKDIFNLHQVRQQE